MMLRNKISIVVIAMLVIVASPTLAKADLLVKVDEPKTIGAKTAIKLELKNTYDENIKSARAAVFLLDDQGKVVGQTTRWLIGGTKHNPSLARGASKTLNVVIASPGLSGTNNPRVKLQFNRLILENERLVDVNKEVTVQCERQ